MVSSNQRSIYEGIRKVVGSSNRGFITLDPERQRPGAPQSPKAGGVAGGSGHLHPARSRSTPAGGSQR